MKLHASPEDRGLRVDVFLAARLAQMTRSRIQSLNRAGAILVDGRSQKDGFRLGGNEVIDVEIPPAPPSILEPQSMFLHVYYEDDELAVIEKPAGVVVHPGSGTGGDTIVHGLLFHFQKLSKAGGETRPGIVHRLDKWTSGLLVVAKDDWTHSRLSKAFQERKVQKTYIALVHGRLAKPQGEISFAIGRHVKIRTRMSVDSSRGRVALSTYRVIEEFPGFSLIEVKIMTGRTHQIRVHLSAIGHPVAGDNVYGESQFREFSKKYGPLGRYFLHAAELQFTHPKSGAALKFSSPLPEQLESFLANCRRGR